jgi:tripartite-type tricarboxylate transporter receptor subunit TctC
MPSSSFRRRVLLAAAATTVAAPARAQAFPQRPIRFICPFPAGGIVDIVMRAVNEEVGAALGQPVVIDPRPRAGGLRTGIL